MGSENERPDEVAASRPSNAPAPIEGPPVLPSSVPPVLAPPVPPLSAGNLVDRLAQMPESQGRLHPLTLVFAALDSLKSFAVPLLAVLVFGRRDGGMSPLFYVFLAIPVYSALVRYFTFKYRIEGGELITRQGLLTRQERHIPLARVQDVRIEQGVLHRLLGVVEAEVETGAGKGPEASLSVLSRMEAERLRQAVIDRMPARGATAPTGDVGAASEEVIRRLTLRDLVFEGLTSNPMASVLVVVALAFNYLDDVLPRERYQKWIRRGTEALTQWSEHSGDAVWGQLALAAGVVFCLSMAMSVAGSVVLFHGFTLARRGEDLRRSYGLLRKRASSLPRRRIQLLKVEEPLLRRLLRLATVRAETASAGTGEEERKSGRDVLLPVVRRGELPGLLPQLLPGLDQDAGQWRPVSRRAIRRGFLKGGVGLLVLTAAFAVVDGLLRGPRWTDVWPLALLPGIYWLNLVSYRHLGYAVGEAYFQMRRGWLGRVRHIVPVRNAQTVEVRESPFDRRHGVMTLLVDTAGQSQAEGGPQVGNVPRAEALALARSLAHRAAATRYQWR